MLGDEAGQKVYNVINIVELAVNIPHIVKGEIKGAKSLVNFGKSIKDFVKNVPGMIGKFKGGVGKFMDNLADGLDNLMGPKQQFAFAGPGSGSRFEMNDYTKVDIESIPKNDIQNNYNKIVNNGSSLEGGSKAEVNRLEYLRGKYGKISPSELHERINTPKIRRMLEDYSPSQKALSWQGNDPYFGKDIYIDKIYSKGTIIYAGEPFPTGYFTSKETLDFIGTDARKIFEGLQVKPYWGKRDVKCYF